MPRIEQHRALQRKSLTAYSDIIDVRSPSEFAEDHIPGAINLPVLSDTERAEVGTIYVRDSRFKARRLGAALVSANIARHLQTVLANKASSYRPLLYCWRGGMRSNAMATVLSAIGWRVAVLERGYKAWRQEVVFALRENPAPLRILLLDGQTGTAKTGILQALKQRGCQTLDLEGAANHRGSVFGWYADAPQPSQKFFESLLWWSLSGLNLKRHIIVEAESNLIGKRALPQRLSASMRGAPRIEVVADLTVRARYLAQTYRDLTANADRLRASINALNPFHSRTTTEHWLKLAGEGDFAQLAAQIAEAHYDPLYSRQRRCAPLQTLSTATLDQAGIAAMADKISDLVAQLDAQKVMP